MSENGPEPWGTIGVPSGIAMVYSQFSDALAGLVSTTQAYTMRLTDCKMAIEIATARSCYVSKARNELVKHSHGQWLFQTDTDHWFPPGLLVRLLKTMYGPDEGPLPVVSGLYFARGTHLPQVYMWRDEAEWTPTGCMRAAAEFPRDEPFTADCVGAGALLVQTAVFEHIENELGRGPFSQITIDTPEGPLQIEDDVAFCYNCRQLEIPIMVDPRALSKHIEATRIGWDEFDAAVGGYELMEAEKTC